MRRAVVALGAVLGVGGCASQSVTLLPGEAGHPVGAVAVIDETGNERGVLANANERAALARRGRVRGAGVAERKVEKRYGALVDALPPPPQSFILNFETGYARITPAQEAELQALFKAAAERPGAEVQVVGHTDTLDSEEVNDRLSRRRAEEVRDYLITRGLNPAQVRATWRGERELLVETADGVANAENRRVEVIVR